MNVITKVAYWLLIIGGLNWLLVGIFSWDIGQLFGGMDSGISRIIYVLVGFATLVKLFSPKGGRKPMAHAPLQSHDQSMGGGM